MRGVASVDRRKDGLGTDLIADSVSGFDLVGRRGIALARGAFPDDDIGMSRLILGRETR